jgi:hypothetical protein
MAIWITSSKFEQHSYSFGKTMFVVLKSETSKNVLDASSRTRKYLKGLDGGLMGPQTSPCNP